MKEDKDQHPQKDIHLDIPSEANREKHINFIEAAENANDGSGNESIEEFAKERKEEWKRGIEEGKEERERREE